jgi:hypothetical protein
MGLFVKEKLAAFWWLSTPTRDSTSDELHFGPFSELPLTSAPSDKKLRTPNYAANFISMLSFCSLPVLSFTLASLFQSLALPDQRVLETEHPHRGTIET